MRKIPFLARKPLLNFFLNYDLCIGSSDLKLSNIQVERNNNDSKTNDFGHRLIEICKISGLVICNGRLEGDNKNGEFTYIDKKGKSTVDYAIISKDLTKFAKNLYVESPTVFFRPFSHRTKTRKFKV